MNLIEQLGGYEKAKEAVHRFLNLQLNEGNPDDVLLLDYVINNRVRPEDILLDYRCKHNIYEAGDKIVFTDKDASDEVLTFEHEELIPIHSYWFEWQSGGEGCVFSTDEIKHATDEEIAAGKRLEVD